MATAPYFVISPNTLLSIIGFLRGPDKTEPTPAENWEDAVIDVVIPAYNEEANLPLAVESIMHQTVKPRKIIVIDDGSSDRTYEIVTSIAEYYQADIECYKRKESIGKTATLKRQAREYDSDVEFVLDGDTVLESRDYIEKTVKELYQGVGISSSCGVILPLRYRDRMNYMHKEDIRYIKEKFPDLELEGKRSIKSKIVQGITNLYRDVLYRFLQKFVYKGQMVFFGTITNPVGCAVAYRRKYIEDHFDRFEPVLGENMTNSEDVFIGFALAEKGYRNIQVQDVTARSLEPEAHHLPRQLYMWSSSFLQSCYYFDDLLRSPFKVFKRYRKRKKVENNPEIQEKRKIKEQYRQAFGRDLTKTHGRPIGWMIMMGAIEKIGFPTALIIMALLQLWEPLVVTILAEVTLSLTITVYISKGERWKYFFKGLAVVPIRYASLIFDLITIFIFAFQIWISGKREWRK